MKLPNFVEVQPNYGFGTLLPQETIDVDVIFSPTEPKFYQFPIICRTTFARYLYFISEIISAKIHSVM